MDSVWKGWNITPSVGQGMLHRHNAVLSGSAALRVAFPDNWEAGDLDFYCPATEFADFCRDLRRFGYVSTRPVVKTPYWKCSAGIRRIAYLANSVTGTTVNVIESTTESPLTPIFFFHSTVVMNVVSADGVTSFYPSLTNDKKGELIRLSSRSGIDRALGLCNFLDDSRRRRNEHALAKYRTRGYSFIKCCDRVGDHQCGGRDRACLQKLRQVADAGVCSLPFNPDRECVFFPRVLWKLGRENEPVGEHRPARVWVRKACSSAERRQYHCIQPNRL